MQPHVTFHVAAPSDAEELAALRIEAMRESLERIGRFDAQRARTRFLSGFSPEHTRLILLAGQRIGFFVVRSEEGTVAGPPLHQARPSGLGCGRHRARGRVLPGGHPGVPRACRSPSRE